MRVVVLAGVVVALAASATAQQPVASPAVQTADAELADRIARSFCTRIGPNLVPSVRFDDCRTIFSVAYSGGRASLREDFNTLLGR